jgi:hypothetical protein
MKTQVKFACVQQCVFLVHTLPLEVCSAAELLHLTDSGLETRLCTTGVLCLCSRFFCVSDMLLRLGAPRRVITAKYSSNGKPVVSTSNVMIVRQKSAGDDP